MARVKREANAEENENQFASLSPSEDEGMVKISTTNFKAGQVGVYKATQIWKKKKSGKSEIPEIINSFSADFG